MVVGAFVLGALVLAGAEGDGVGVGMLADELGGVVPGSLGAGW